MSNTAIIIASLFPLLIYMIVGMSKNSKVNNIDEYFIYGQQVSLQDYATTSVGYALQMAAIFLFAYWGILYGLGAIWVPIFWFLGFFLLYKLLPKFMPFHEKKHAFTLHQYLTERFSSGPWFQRVAACATILGLWGTMMAEIDYVIQTYVPVVNDGVIRYMIMAGFLIFGVLYIIINGYKAEVNTERIQVPIAYAGLIFVLLLTLPKVFQHSGHKPYIIILSMLVFTFLLIIIAKMVQGWNWQNPFQDKQILIPIAGILGAIVIHLWVKSDSINFSLGSSQTVLDNPIWTQMHAQGYFGLFSLFIANVFWMPVDISTWQRVASVRGDNSDGVLRALRRGTLRVMIESPASWLLGVCLGLIINASGLLSPGKDPSEGLSAFSLALFNGAAVPYLGSVGPWLYLIFIISCISIMLSTVNSIISAIAFTLYRDMLLYTEENSLLKARLWTVIIIIAGLIVFPILRHGLGSDLPTFLYASYSAQLSLLIIVMLALSGKKLSGRPALWSLASGLGATFISFILASRIPDKPEVAVLPPIFAVLGSLIGYILAYKR